MRRNSSGACRNPVLSERPAASKKSPGAVALVKRMASVVVPEVQDAIDRETEDDFRLQRVGGVRAHEHRHARWNAPGIERLRRLDGFARDDLAHATTAEHADQGFTLAYGVVAFEVGTRRG